MKAKNYLIRTAVVIVTIAAIFLFTKEFPIVENLLINLAFYATLIGIALFSINYNFKNITLGIIYGMLISVTGYIIYLFIIVFNRIFG